jgi:hypothetical protein
MKQTVYSGNSLNTLMSELPLDANEIKYVDNNGYKDVIIPLGTLSADSLLYVEFDLKIDRVYSTTYKLKLVNQNNYNNYEIVKVFTVAAEPDDDMDASLVCLYEVPGQRGTNAAIPVLITDYSAQPENPETYFTDKMGFAGTLWCYYDNNGEEVYYHYFGNGKSELVEEYNDMIIRHSWINPSEDSIYHFSGLISSRYSESGFDALIIEIEREHVDEEIIHATDADTKHFYGRLIDIDALDFKAKTINKLLPKESNAIIKKIGVQGHPGLTMVINGEEIKMGPSGLFELNDFDITSFGVCGDAKRFIVDYQYVIINEEEGS